VFQVRGWVVDTAGVDVCHLCCLCLRQARAQPPPPTHTPERPLVLTPPRAPSPATHTPLR
jgi:hypothetical protein